ncbi:MAG: peptidoglycan-binding domain-containing protein [Candidatus Krumholzibacteriia bacterium]
MKSRMMTWGLLLAVASVAASGCSSSSTKDLNTDDSVQEALRSREAQIEELQAKLATSQKEAASARDAANQAESRAQQVETAMQDMSSAQGASSAEAMLLPPNAQPGECYARVLIPEVYETGEEQVLVREAGEKVEIVPARYDWVEEDVLVREASEKLEVVPATFETVEEQILVKPASKELQEVPAVYETVTEKVLVTPERTYWKKGRGLIERVDNSTGEVMCLVKEPAVYKTVSKRVLKSKAGVQEVEIPAEYKTLSRQVVKEAAHTRTVTVPAVYKSVKVRKLAEPARETRTAIPAEYKTVQNRRMVQPSRLEWRPVLCETNMSGGVVSELQRALKGAGFDPGPIDGIYGRQTQGALTAYQKSKGLASGGLTYATIEALGIKL